MHEVVVHLLLLGEDVLDRLAVLVDVELGDAADRDLEQALHVVKRHVAAQLGAVRLEALDHGLLHALVRLLLLDALVDALLHEDAVEGAGVEEVVQLREADLQLAAREEHEPVHVLLQDLRDRHQLRTPRVQHDRARGDGALAVGERVERGLHLVLRLARRELQLDLDVLGGEVVDLAHLHLLLLDRVLDVVDERVRGLAPRERGDHELVLVAVLDDGAHLHLAEAVLVLAHVHDAAGLEVGVELERLLLDEGDLRLEELDEVVREDRRRKAHGDAVRAHHEEERDLRGQEHGLLLAPVVVRHEVRGLGVEHFVPREVGEAALDVTRGGGGHARVEVAVVSLAVDEVALALAPQLVREHHDRVADRRVAVRVVLHGVADDVRHLRVLPVVLLPERVEDAALDGLEPVLHRGDRARADHVGGVLAEVEVEELPERPVPRQPRRRRHRPCVRHRRHRGRDALLRVRARILSGSGHNLGGSGRACRGRIGRISRFPLCPRVGEKVERIKQARWFVVLFLLAHLSENLCGRVLYQNPLKS